jgi:hypothetical protein
MLVKLNTRKKVKFNLMLVAFDVPDAYILISGSDDKAVTDGEFSGRMWVQRSSRR